MKRRTFLASASAAAVLPLLPEATRAEYNSIEPFINALTQGAPVKKGRVKLELPPLADNGNSVAMKLMVDSPMTAADHVQSVHLFSERNPVARMASFYFGPDAGKAEVVSRVRLAGSQHVTAIAQLSDGSFWSDKAEVIVTLSACLDES